MAIKLKPGIVAEMPVSNLERDPKQPRQTFIPESLLSLAESLKIRQEEPIKVRQEGKRTIIVDGERRWRAAKLGKIKKVLVLLDDRTEMLDIAATQLTTAVQREELSALDIAEFLVGLQKREKATTNDLLAALAARGIKEIGPAKLERIMRLVELPDWAKKLMREGHLGAGHGQALLQAIKFPAVLKHVKERVNRDLNWKGGVTVTEVEQSVANGFHMAGTNLNRNYGAEEDIRAFPIEQCRSCEFYKKIDGNEYCLNRKLFDKKQKEALLLKAQKEAQKREREQKKGKDAGDRTETDPSKVEPRKVKLNEHNVVPLRRMSYDVRKSLGYAPFDTSECKTCPHRHLASHDGKPEEAEDHCFHPPCYDEKSRRNQRTQSKLSKMREYLEAWLRPIVVREAPKRLNQNQQTAMLLWLATGAVERGSSIYGGQMHERAARATQPFLQRHRLFTLPKLVEWSTASYGPPHLQELVAAAVQVMTREQLRWFARYMEIKLDEPALAYRVDEGYLRMKRKAELQQMLREALRGADTDASEVTIAKIGTDGLRELAIEHAEQIGVPADLRALYEEDFKSDDWRDSLDELDEDELLGDELTVCIGCGCTHMDPCEEGCAWVVQEQIDERRFSHEGPYVGVCSAPDCAPHMERWRRGDRTLSPAAEARMKERKAMMDGEDDELSAAAEDIEAIAEEKPRRRKRA